MAKDVSRRGLTRLGVAALAAPAIWPVSRARAAAHVTLRLAHPDTRTHPTQTVAEHLAADVAKKTDGAVKIQVFSGGELGSEKNIVAGMQTGIIDLGFHTSGFLESVYPHVQVLDLPFIFKDDATAARVLDGPVGQKLLAEMPAKGIYGFIWGHYGWREVETVDHPVREPADLQGIKIRIQPGAVFAATFKALGAVPVVLDIAEVYLALSQKTVGAVELPFLAVRSQKLYEVTKNAGLTNHVYNAGAFMASKRKFDALDPAYQNAIRQAAHEIQPFWRQLVTSKSVEDQKFCEAHGVSVTKTDYPAFRKAVEPVYSQFRESIGAQLVDDVLHATTA